MPLGVLPVPAIKLEGFGVVFAGPSGEAAPESEIQILFSRPLRAIGTLADAPTPPIQLRPNIEGTWRWLGTQALVFSPAQRRLPFATAIDVEVPAETRAFDGTSLGRAHRFQLRTPTPKLVEVTPSDESTHLRGNSQFEIVLDQAVGIEPLRAKLSLLVEVGGKSESYPFVLAALTDKRKDHGFRLTPKWALPRSAVVRISLGAGLAGLEGPLSTTAVQSKEFATIAPLRVEKVDCERSGPKSQCDSRTGIDLEFNNPVTVRGLRVNLTIDGKRAKLASWYADDEVTSFVHLPGPFRAGTKVTLRVSGTTKDDFGQLLEQPHVEQIAFDDFYPKMEIGLQGDIFETALPTSIPIGVVNVARYERLYVPLPLSGLSALLTAEDADELFARGRLRPEVRLDQQAPAYARNQMGVDSFDPAGKAGALLGAGLVAVRYPGFDREGKAVTLTDARLVQRTNLGISGQVGRHASVVWVTELDTGHSIANAEVLVLEANDKIRARSMTDAQGIAVLGPDAIDALTLEQPWKHQAAIVVTRGKDLAFRRISDLLPEWRIPVSVDRTGQLSQKLMLFTERGQYRPGERVDVKAVLRDELPRGLSLPKARSVKLELLSPDNIAVGSVTTNTSEFGTLSAHFSVPLSARTGQWSIRASSGKVALGSTELTIGEYRPVELEVSVEPASKVMVRGGRLAVSVLSRTLFGMAAAGAKARLEAYRERTSFVPPGAEAYITDADEFDSAQRDDNFQRAQLLLSEVMLDQHGRTDASVSAELPAARGPEWIHFEAEITDAGQNPVAATSKTLVHPAQHYVGLRRSLAGWISAPSKLPVDVAVFALDGTRPSGKVVELELLRRQWSVVRQEASGVVQSKSLARDEVVGRCRVHSAATDQRCVFDVARPGNYFVVARSKDDQQRVATSAQAVFAAGAGPADIVDEDDRRIELVPDKTEYRVGDVAKILVKSVITDSDALVVVGRSDVQSAERRHLTGHTPIVEVPILDDMRPNLFVTIQLVTGRVRPPAARPEQPDLGAPTHRIGWAELKIDSSDRRLAVELQPSTRAAMPGASVDVAVTLRDASLRPVRGEVTLWAVDEGVLALGNYEVPDPFRIFLGSRPLQLLPMESRESLGRRTLASMREELGLSKGTPGSGGGLSDSARPVRQDFRATAFFLPNLVTDAQGQVKATLRLPDGLTSYKVFALAVTGAEQYGFASDRIVTSKPLMVRPTLPRFFRAGDRAEIGVVVSAKDVPDANVAVTLSASGVTPKQQKQNARLAGGSSVELFFPIVASGPESSSLTIEAQSDGLKDSVKLSRPVQRSIAMEVVAQAGETNERALAKLGDLAGVRSDQGELEVQLSNSFLGGSAGGFQQLVEYPYGCSEQISSRLLALLPLAELAKVAGIALPKDRNQLIEMAIGELVRRQRQDGGFGMWSGAERSDPWVSAHVLGALNEAKKGRPSLTPTLERGAEYLHSLAAGFIGSETLPVTLAALPYVVDVLFRMGKGDPGTLTRLYSLRQQMPPFAQALLLHAYALSRHDAKAVDDLVSGLERSFHQDGSSALVVTNVGDDYARLFDTKTRTAAMVIWALAAAKPEHPLLMPLARGLLSARRNGRWETTQDSAFALLALDAVRSQKHISSSGIEAKVTLGELSVFSGAIGGESPTTVTQRLRMDALKAGNQELLFETRGGPLLYEARLRYVPMQPAKAAIDAGFAIERAILQVGLDGRLAAPTAVEPEACIVRALRGQSFVVELAVVVPRPRDFVVIDTPLPAGFEAIDVTHQTSSAWMSRLDRMEALGPEGSDAITFHRDIRDDRVTFLVDHFPVGLYRLRYLVRAVTRGSFALPPARVEAMYAPEHFGTTSPCAVEIR